jgi:hypothetical protein
MPNDRLLKGAGRRDERRGASHPPGPDSGYASSSRSPSCSFGHGLNCLPRLLVACHRRGQPDSSRARLRIQLDRPRKSAPFLRDRPQAVSTHVDDENC